MPSPLRQVLLNLAERLDEDLVPLLYEAAGRSSEEIRAELDGMGLHRHDPQAGLLPGRALLASSGEVLVDRSVRRATIRGAIAGAAGLLAMPPELLAAGVQTLRLAQRLAVLHGYVLETDRGKLMLARALAAGLEVELPEQARVDFRVRQLPVLFKEQTSLVPLSPSLAGRLVLGGATRTLAARVGRVIPGVGSGVAALSARRGLRGQGRRMLDFYQRTWDGPMDGVGVVEDAVEIAG